MAHQTPYPTPGGLTHRLFSCNAAHGPGGSGKRYDRVRPGRRRIKLKMGRSFQAGSRLRVNPHPTRRRSPAELLERAGRAVRTVKQSPSTAQWTPYSPCPPLTAGNTHVNVLSDEIRATSVQRLAVGTEQEIATSQKIEGCDSSKLAPLIPGTYSN